MKVDVVFPVDKAIDLVRVAYCFVSHLIWLLFAFLLFHLFFITFLVWAMALFIKVVIWPRL